MSCAIKMYALGCALFISFLSIPGCFSIGMQMNKLDHPVGSKTNPGVSCKDIKARGGTISKNYYIALGGSTVKVYCDQTTAGGGWTLVYSYTFTKPEDFDNGKNAVTPRPDWPQSGNVPISTNIPTSETDYNAMPFALWKKLGREFLIKSNINNWIWCTEESGSLAKFQSGKLRCKLVKNVMKRCGNVVPDAIEIDFYRTGVNIYDSKVPNPIIQCYYYLDTVMGPETFPIHDPCGGWQVYSFCGISKPRGNIYFR